jgi:hypothetical protein
MIMMMHIDTSEVSEAYVYSIYVATNTDVRVAGHVYEVGLGGVGDQ